MVKISLITLALIAAPSVLATSTLASEDLDSRQISEQHVHGRELTNKETIFARETDFDELFSRFAEGGLDTRDLDIQDLSERSKIGRFFRKLWHGIKKVASVVIRRDDSEDLVLARDNELDIRELEALFERYLDESESRQEAGIRQLEAREFNSIDLDLTTRDIEEDAMYERGIDNEAVFDGRDFEFEEREINDLD